MQTRAGVNAKPPVNAGPAAANGAVDTSQSVSSIHPLPSFVKNFPDELKALAQAAHDAGDYAAYWDYRRRYLLAQATAYSQGGSHEQETS
jgi:hypothetical protein